MWYSNKFPTSRRSSCSIQNPSLHQGIGVNFQPLASIFFFTSFTEASRVFTLIFLRRKDKEYFLNSSQSVSSEYLSIKAGLKTKCSVLGICSGSDILLKMAIFFK